MAITSALLWFMAMIGMDYRDGVKGKPRPTRAKAAYVTLLVCIGYQALITFGHLNWPGFYELASALFGKIGKAIVDSIRWKE